MAGDTHEAERSMAVDDDTPSRPVRWKRPSRRVARFAAILVASAACLAFFHKPILRGLASILVVDESSSLAESASPPNCVLVVEGDASADGRYDETARLYREHGVRRIVLIRFSSNPVVRSGAMLPLHTRGRRALASVDVPAEAIEVIPGDARNTWEAARQLQPWLKDRPTVRLLVLVHRLRSRHQRYVFDSILEPSVAARVSVYGLKEPRCNEANWWKSRHGVKRMMFAGLELMHAWCFGESRPSPSDWDPDDYERTLREAMDKEAPVKEAPVKEAPAKGSP